MTGKGRRTVTPSSTLKREDILPPPIAVENNNVFVTMAVTVTEVTEVVVTTIEPTIDRSSDLGQVSGDETHLLGLGLREDARLDLDLQTDPLGLRVLEALRTVKTMLLPVLHREGQGKYNV